MLSQKYKLSALSLSLAALAGCSMTAVYPLNNEVEKNKVEAEAYFDSLKSGNNKVARGSQSSVEKMPGEVYIPVKKVSQSKIAKKESNPALQRQIAFNRSFNSAQEFAERVTGLTGIPVSVAPDVLEPPGLGTGAIAGTLLNNAMQNGTTGALPPLPNAGMPMPSPMGMGVGMGMGMPGYGGLSGGQVNPLGFPINLSFSGSVSGLLDVATTRMGVAWEMQDGQIKLFRYTSRTFRITALPGDTNMDANIGQTGAASGSSGGGASGGGATASSNAQKAGVKFSGLSVWKGIEDAVKAMLTPKGKVLVAPALGTITVTDTPSVVGNVAQFVDDQNAALSKQVVVNVRVLSVDLNNTDAYGINWDALYKSMAKNGAAAFATAFSPIAGAGVLTASVLNTAGNGTGSTIQSWQGSQSIIEALSTQGKVSSLTSASVTTLNNQPAPLQVGRQTSYIASSAASITTGVSTTTLTPGVVTTGYSMTMIPHVIDGKKMLLQYAIDMSSLLSLKTVSSGNASLQTPDLDARTSIQRVMVNSGDTIIVTGFENNEINAQTQGVLDATNPLLGGGVNAKRGKATIVILIQPVLVDA